MTRRWGNSPKCWKTIDSLVRRSTRRAAASIAVTSSPSMRTVPDVGSINRDRQRINVDLPLPDRPITTNVSPRSTSNDIDRTATVWPVTAWISWRDAPAVAMSIARRWSPFPNTFHRSATSTTVSRGMAEQYRQGATPGRSGEDGYVGHRRSDRRIGQLVVDHLAGQIRLVGGQVEVAVPAERREDHLRLTRLLARQRLTDGCREGVRRLGAGMIPSARAKLRAAAKHSRCGMATASTRPSS